MEATLGFRIDSSPASAAAVDLDKLTAAAVKTERSVESLNSTARGLGGALGAAKRPIDDIGRSFGQQDAHIAAFRAEIERLTTKFAPLDAAAKRYESTLADIRRAQQFGIIDTRQMTSLIDQERLAYERLKASTVGAGQAMKAANSNRAGANNFNAANAGYQFQDIAVTAAAGVNPLMIGLQQGTQLASVVGSMERPVAGLAAAFASLLSPVSLVTIGLTAGAAALIQYVASWAGGDQITDDLKAQNDLIVSVAEKWGNATPKLKAYADEVSRLSDAQERMAAGDAAAAAQFRPIVDVLGSINEQYTAAIRNLRSYGEETSPLVRELSESFSTLQSKIMDGKATTDDLSAVQKALASALEDAGTPAVRKLADAFSALVPRIEAATKAASEFRQEGSGASLSTIQDILSGNTFRDNSGRIQYPRTFTPRNPAVPTARPLVELEGMPGDQKKKDQQQSNYDRAIDAAKQRIAQTELEAQVAGKLGAASDALRFKLNLLHDAQDKGKEVTASQRAEIDALTEAYQRASAAAADARFNTDMAFNWRQLRRTGDEQKIANTLRQYGKPDDVNSPAAMQIRAQMQYGQAKEAVTGFLTTFKDGLINNGGDIGDAFGKAILSPICGPQFPVEFNFEGEGL